MLELLYVSIDDEGFINHITSMETENSIGMYLDPNSDLVLGFRKYRYDVDNNEFIYDESKVIDECKECLKQETEQYLRGVRDTRFGVKLSSGNYTFDYGDGLRSILSSNNGIMGMGLSNLFRIPCIDENEQKTTVKLGILDFTALMKAMVEFANYFEEMLEERLSEANSLTTIDEIKEFKERYNIDLSKIFK